MHFTFSNPLSREWSFIQFKDEPISFVPFREITFVIDQVGFSSFQSAVYFAV